MTEVFVDFEFGDDDDGDGSRTAPYLSLDKASTGLSPGDSIKCGQTDPPVLLSGTLSLVHGSQEIGTSVDLTSEIPAGYLLGLNDGMWYEVSEVVSTKITLVLPYLGETNATASGYRVVILGIDQQQINCAGGEPPGGDPITISGGWDLSQNPAVRSGMTRVRMPDHLMGTYAGWYFGGLIFEYFGLGADGDYPTIYSFEAAGVTVLHCEFYTSDGEDNGSLGFTEGDGVVSDITFSNNFCCHMSGLVIDDTDHAHNVLVRDCEMCGSILVELRGVGDVLIDNCTCYPPEEEELQVVMCKYCTNVIVRDITLVGTPEMAYFWFSYSEVTVFNLVYDDSDMMLDHIVMSEGSPVASLNEFNGDVYRDMLCFDVAYILKNTTEADGGGACLEFVPHEYDSEGMSQPFFVPATANTARTVSIKLKMDSEEAFDGTVDMELWFFGERITLVEDVVLTTSYVAKSIVGAALDIPIDGVLEMKLVVHNGTAGAVYADTVSYS